jgi:phosphopantetheinyl transferase (holo-ACP synthase)
MVIDGGRPLVGLLDSASLPAGACTTWLSEPERRDAQAIANNRRRDEWTAGRIAAKYVFLHRDRFGGFIGTGALSLQSLTGKELAGFSPEAYSSVSVTKDKSPGGGPARVGWGAENGTVKVAISHTRGLACAFIGTGEVYSLDVEVPSRRLPAFYLQNFTEKERDWASASARQFDLNPDWLYALLWSAKECLLKTPQFLSLSLWNMPGLEIDIPGAAEYLTILHHSDNLSRDFHFLKAEVFSPASSKATPSHMHFQLAVSGTADLILTVITRLD